MDNFVPSGLPIFFYYATFDQQTGLFFGMTTQNMTDLGIESSPGLMTESSAGSGIYTALTTLTKDKQYLITRRAYTDGTLTTVDPSRSPQVSLVYASDFSAVIDSFQASISAVAAGSGFLGTISVPQYNASVQIQEVL